MELYTRIPFCHTELTEGFWGERQKINREKTIYSILEQFENTGRFRSFEFEPVEKSGIKPHFFWDSDIAKWIESVAYLIEKKPDRVLERKADEVIDLIEKNMDESGYFNLYFTLVEPENRFQKREYHELYCAGHLIEAAVAYYHATAKDKLLNCMCRYVDYIEKVFVQDRSAAFQSPGHEEIELALFKLYRLTGEEKYKNLAMHFLNIRGTIDSERGLYSQTHLPIREQKTAEGHCVRACYLYSAMADAAAETGDKELLAACQSVFDNIVKKRSYITGGIGSTRYGEAFSEDYDLPNSTAYAETCAAISLAFFAGRLQRIEPNPEYADIIEKIIYNGMLSGVSLDGKSFFYENPLEISRLEQGRGRPFGAPNFYAANRRKEVFDCSCCPPNLSRFIAAIADYLYTTKDETVYVHQYMQGKTCFPFCGKQVEICQKTGYPYEGKIHFHVKNMKGKKLALRIPFWSKTTLFQGKEIEKPQTGYFLLEISDDAYEFTLSLDISPRPVYANPAVAANAMHAAFCAGPLVYCAESCDNETPLRNHAFLLPLHAQPLDLEELKVRAYDVACLSQKKPKDDALYTDKPEYQKTKIRLIPYYAFANREEADMLVWFPYHE